MVLCSLACHPEQSRFMTPEVIEEFPGIDNDTVHTVIKSVNIFLRDSYAQGLYESCKEIGMPSSNSKAIATFCGNWGENCNGHR